MSLKYEVEWCQCGGGTEQSKKMRKERERERVQYFPVRGPKFQPIRRKKTVAVLSGL